MKGPEPSGEPIKKEVVITKKGLQTAMADFVATTEEYMTTHNLRGETREKVKDLLNRMNTVQSYLSTTRNIIESQHSASLGVEDLVSHMENMLAKIEEDLEIVQRENLDLDKQVKKLRKIQDDLRKLLIK